MPLPWKKTKVARISRLVADLHSPKRGGSLVVQTGFPTSLVDLFVKNRDRLKKHSKSKSQSHQTHSKIDIPPNFHNLTVNSSTNEIVTTTHVQEFVVVEEFDGGGGSGGFDGSNRNSVLVAGLKMFVMVVLALSTKRLAVGVTMSAILLLLLEYVLARGLLSSKPTTFLVSSLRRIKFNKNVECVNKSEICEESLPNSGCELVDDVGVEEIQVEEEIRLSDQNKGSLDSEEEVKRKDVLMTGKTDRSRGAKFKEKLVKRLVPKKLRGSKRLKKNQVQSSSQSSVFVGEDKLGRILEQEQDDENEPAIVSFKEEVSLEEEKDARKGQSCTEEKVGRERVVNFGYLILILIVLAGLVGGRIVAIVLILSWFLMLKLIEVIDLSSAVISRETGSPTFL